jgi:adenine deaminase
MNPRMTSRTRIATATVAALVASLLGACARPPQPGAATLAGNGTGAAPATQAAPGKQVDLDAETRLRQLLVQVALGEEPADTLIHGPTVLNVVTGAWEKDQDIVIRSGRIAWVGNAGGWKGTAKETVDASKEWAVPGFGESHKHIESTYLTPEYEASLVIPRGNTFTVEDSHELSNVVGNHNVAFWLEAEAKGSPLKIFPSVGSATPPTIYEHGGGYYGYNEMQGFLQSDLRVISLGEVMDWPAVIDSKAGSGQRIWEMIQATRNQRGVVEGHGAGLTDAGSINAFAAAGLSSDHEARLPEEGYEKLKRGVFLEVRVDTAQDLFPYLVKQGLKDWSNVSVTTDDRDVYATLQLGSMDYNIRNAIALGVPTITAYQMGSYNTARHFHIDHLVGSITPGRHADVVLLSDPDKVAITRVFANGRLASHGNEYLLEVPKIEYPEWVRQTVKVGRRVTGADFVIRAPDGAKGEANVALVEPFWFQPDFITEKLPVQADGTLLADAARGITKVAVVDRYSGKGEIAKMFWRNTGPKTPGTALASSQSHDLHNLWVVGNDDAAMALAINTLSDLQGGWVLVSGGKVVSTVKLEVGGLMTPRPVKEVAAELEALHTAADQLEWIAGPGLPDRLRFAFLTASPWKWQLVAPYEGNPVGFVNVATGETHAVVW